MIRPNERLFGLLVAFLLATHVVASVPETDKLQDFEAIATATIDKAIEIEGADYANFQKEQQQQLTEKGAKRQLQGSGDKGLGDRCNDDSDCVDGLDCVDATLGKKCRAVSCFFSAIEKLEETFDPQQYIDDVLELAGITPTDVTAELGSVLTPFGLGNTEVAGLLNEAMKAIPPPHAEFQALLGSSCPGTFTSLATNETDAEPTQSASGSTTTLGFWTEAGAGGNIGFEVMTANGDADQASAILNKWCFGVKVGGGLGFTFAYGLHSTGTFEDLINCSVLTSAGGAAGVGVFVGNVCTILGIGGTVDGVETQVGLGAGGGLGTAGCLTQRG